MRILLLFSWLLIGATDTFGQAPASPPAQPPAGAPAARRPAQPARRTPPANTRGGVAITVTDPAGETLEGIEVQVTGATDRRGTTNASGQLNFPGLQAGTYRL